MAKHSIANVFAREILSSGGSPTVEATVTLQDGSVGVASVPFGVSAGSHEAVTLVDNDPKRYGGKGMQRACAAITGPLAGVVVGQDATDQRALDGAMRTLDGTPNKNVYGGNSMLAVSLASARAAATSLNLPLYAYLRHAFNLPHKAWRLPKPMAVSIEGGLHADDSTDFQEYLLSVIKAPSAAEAVRMMEETYAALRTILKQKGLNVNVGNEGAFAPAGLQTNEAPLALLQQAIVAAGYVPGQDIGLSIDAASSEVYNAKEQRYVLKRESSALTASQMVGLFQDWQKRYPIVSIEDGLAEDDWEHWPALFSTCSAHSRIVGDDLTVTNSERIQRAIDAKAINAVLIKLNQIGSLTEAMDAVLLGQRHGFWQVVSHRGGGETSDTFMIDFAAAVNAEYVKVGPVRGERTEKYNRLTAIAEEVEST